ncbi:MAG: XRE family transcriptional regulator [Gammaproteobacteria bacterium]
MAHKFNELRQRLPAEVRARAGRRTEKMLGELPLHELRRAREFSQHELAEILQVQQAGISKLERRTDIYLSTLRRYIEAMGGELEITARFPDGAVRIQRLGEIADTEDSATV